MRGQLHDLGGDRQNVGGVQGCGGFGQVQVRGGGCGDLEVPVCLTNVARVCQVRVRESRRRHPYLGESHGIRADPGVHVKPLVGTPSTKGLIGGVHDPA